MRKKIAFLLVAVMVSLMLMPLTVMAYPGGLLNGRTMNFGGTPTGTTFTSVKTTDSNVTTYETFNNTTTDTLWTDITGAVTIDTYRLDAQGVGIWELHVINSNNVDTKVVNMTPDDMKHTFTPVTDVKKYTSYILEIRQI